MSRKNFAFLFLLLSITLNLSAQNPVEILKKQQLVNGFAKALQGETISYFSVFPKYVKEALLTRCTDGNKIIEWETDAIPQDAKGSYVYFTWIGAHADGTSSGTRKYDLYINDQLILTFTTYPNQYPPYWTFAGKDSTRIWFENKTKDGAMDAHGMVYLRVPLSKYTKGEPLKMKIAGQSQNSNDWFMTFKYAFKEKVDISPLPFLLRGQKNMQPVQLTILHFGTPAKAEISIAGKINKRYDVQNGFNVFELPVKAVKVKTALKIHAAIGNLLSEDISILQNPIVFREIDLIHNAHTDIGYSHIQEEVINIHNQNIRNAIDLIEKTKDYPEGSKFTWHVESSWVAENFMKVATEKEKQLFIKDVKKGQIVISGTFANVLTGLSTPEEMNWITEYSCKLRDSFGFPIKTAMMSDIPGMSWSMVQALAQHGIRYFSNGPNYVENFPDKGDRIGHTLNDLGDKPFWWKSPSGKDSILFWTCGKGYSSWHGFSQGLVMERGPDKIAGYINELDAKGYPYEMLQWRYNIVADNGTTDSSISTFVQQWNEKYSSPKLVLANATELFERFEQRYGKTIPVYSGDFTPYWEDGAYSTAYEEAETRMLSERIEQLENIAKQNSQVLNADWLYQAKRNIVLFHEHTWGAWCSITKPDDPFTIHQWNYKKSFMDSAKYFTDLIETALFSETSNPSSITVFNDLSWSRTGYAEVPNPANVKANSLADESGNIIPLQKNSDGKLSFIAKDIPANGQKTYRLTENNIKPDFVTNFNCAVDSVTGSIKALTSKERQWVNNNEYKGILQALYVNGLNPSSFVLSSFKKMEWVDNGPAVKRMRITCSMDGTNELVYEISLFNGLDMVQFSAIIDKKAIREKESLHIAFPFAIDNAKVRIGVGDGIISPNDKQIPGSNKDFFSVQRWIDVSGNNDGITLSCPQGALFEVGEMVNEERTLDGYKKWKDSASSSSTIFLYAMNNYWHTNYKADQPGKVRFDFYLHPHKNFEAANATRFGYESTQPLKAWLH